MNAPVAIITGASQGIGAGLVAGYRRAGYAVVGVELSLPSSDDHDDEWASAGDIAEAETARHAVDQALDRFGRIDTLINNAGIYIGKPVTQYTIGDYPGEARHRGDVARRWWPSSGTLVTAST
jgi:NAD(P)-dependent dehydrogenase (short-subunit alcohol dehydrogenase family)